MGTFVICWSVMSGSLHGLHLHSFIGIKSYKVQMQEHMFILSLFTKVLVKSLFIS